MRFTIEKKIFLEKLEIINKIIPNQVIENIFLFVKIVLNDKTIELTGSDGITSIQTFIKNKNIIYNCKNGSTLVQTKYLIEIIKKLNINDKYFTLEVLENEKIIEISDSKKKISFKLKCLNEEIKYPEFNFISYKKKINISTKDFINSINKTYFAASNKNSHPILNAINLNLNNGIIFFNSSDSFRFARTKNELKIKNVNFNINIPVKIMCTISSIFFKNNDDIEISTDDLKVIFSSKNTNTIISSNLLKGDFPSIKIFDDFEKNKNNIYSLKINAKIFLKSLERVLILSNEEKIIKMTILNNKNKEIKLFSEYDNIGNVTEVIDDFSSNINNNFEICFNGKYAIDAIKALVNFPYYEENNNNNEENEKNFSEDYPIEFQFISKNKPFIIKNLNDDSVIQVIAPISE